MRCWKPTRRWIQPPRWQEANNGRIMWDIDPYVFYQVSRVQGRGERERKRERGEGRREREAEEPTWCT